MTIEQDASYIATSFITLKKMLSAIFCFLSLSLIATIAFAQKITPLSQLIQQTEQQQAFIRQQVIPDTEPALIDLAQAKPPLTTTNDTTCFDINKVQIEQVEQSPSLNPFMQSVLQANDFEKSPDQRGVFHFTGDKTPCMTTTDIQNLANAVQNAVIDSGRVTARVLIPEQNLTSGELRYLLLAGKIGNIQYSEEMSGANLGLKVAFPTTTGKELNLRDLEQGLDNMRRISSKQTQMNIVPGSEAQTSHIVINQTKLTPPYSFNFAIDDSGSGAVGKYIGTAGFTWQDPLSLNDIFHASYSHTLKPGKELSDQTGTQKSGSQNLSFSYSVPVGYWLFDVSGSQYDYDQVVAGQTLNYRYSGESEQVGVNLSRILYRNQYAKTKVSYGLWYRGAKNFVNDTEVDVQRRRMGGWQAHVNQQLYLGRNSVNLDMGYKRGTGLFNSMPAPESYWDEGTERMKVITADIVALMPFELGERGFSWQTNFHGQWPKTRLTALDKLSIGGRNTIRGFDGGTTLSAERGWYLRNEIAWHYKPQHKAYIGIDTGHVSGPSAQYLPGQSLTGAALGISGSLEAKGAWFYDAFLGFPVKHPDNFPTSDTVAGFTLSYRWP